MNSIQESHESFKIKVYTFLKKVVLYIAREIKIMKISFEQKSKTINIFKYTIRFKEATCSDRVIGKNILLFLITVLFMMY